MTKKVVFLDVDGTLVIPKGEIIPESAISACQKARENGHFIFLCTGRSKPEIYSNILDIGFDGMVSAGGGCVEVNGEIIYHKKMAHETIKHIVDYFDNNNFDFILESNSGMISSKNLIPRLKNIFQTPHPFVDLMKKIEDNFYPDDVNKVLFLENKNFTFDQVKKEFEKECELIAYTIPIFGEESGEILVPGMNKTIGISKVLAHLGIKKEDSIALGDGSNDIEMIQYCGFGVAMGNASDKLKEIADDITDDIEADGLYNSFKKLQLI